MQTASFDTLFLIPFLPLLGASLLCLFGRRMDKDLVSIIALSSVLGAFAVACLATYHLLHGEPGGSLENTLWTWAAVGKFQFDLTLGLDRLSSTLILVVTGVGFLIHLYSVGYMHDDPAYFRYFAYLNFFIFAMSTLVLGRSLPVMFFGWEGVGLASYLLIGFWYSDLDKAKAGMKAFVTNRIGDFGFLLGMFVLLALFRTADFIELGRRVAQHAGDADVIIASGLFQGYSMRTVVTAACLLLFLGATGKSAQIPLFVWLPDAMAGPTPVSALIHAATMVTAGVYMISRLYFLYDLAPVAQHVVAWTGAATAFLAATIGLAQNDIKKVLAYSTVSQLGYMFLAAGVGAYSASIFHLVTHAFFKACLFLGSGAVIHALHGEQDMRKMGGLRDELPWVYWTFLLSTLALAGVPPLSGFFSKDAILANAYEHDPALWAVGFVSAGMTALYMMRLVCLTFLGKSRVPLHHGKKMELHHPGPTMVLPLVVLAALATVAGIYNLPEVFNHWFHLPAGLFDNYIAAVTGGVHASELAEGSEALLLLLGTVMALAGLGVGYALYKDGPSKFLEGFTRAGPGRLGLLWLQGRWFVDELYGVLITVLRAFAASLAMVFDPLLDGILTQGSSRLTFWAGTGLSSIQTGNVQSYATVFVVASAAVMFWVLR